MNAREQIAALSGSGLPRGSFPGTKVKATGRRFYRPELDALRFVAFLAVLLHHGPGGNRLLWLVCSAGGFGLSMFFVLSAYLITELLIREYEQTGNIAWNLFFVRRALRIWPLYFGAIVVAFVIGRLGPPGYWIPRRAVVVMALFVANWSKLAPGLGLLVGPLWSISIEEQFYLIWPPIVKVGGKGLILIVSLAIIGIACVWLWVFSEKGWLLWYDTVPEFSFFATGALIALGTRRRATHKMRTSSRTALVAMGILVLLLTAHFGYVGTVYIPGVTTTNIYIKYAGGAIGCTLIFLAVLGVTEVSSSLIYLGKISYGLYVFHMGMLKISEWLTLPLMLKSGSAAKLLIVDGIALLLSIIIAHFSYRYFEKPFMRFKESFAVIKSRPA